jgi:Raf kinase inhibitor-like YbhB/YbcL family protein
MFLALGAAAAGPILVACDTNDGRGMQPPTSYEQWVLQNTAPSTSTTTTTLPPPSTLPPPTDAAVVTVPDTSGDSVADTVDGSVTDTGAAASDDASSSVDAAAEASLPVDTFAESLGLANLATEGVEFTGPWPAAGQIPVEYTCTGEENVPLLTWTAPPADTVEMALVVVDETADDFAHWIVIGLPPEAGSVGGPEPVAVGIEAMNSVGNIGWAGPCPPDPDAHTYRFTLYALSQAIELPPESLPDDLIQAIEASATGATSFTGTYQVA